MSPRNPYELRNVKLDALLFVVNTCDLEAIRAEMSQRLEAAPDFFADEAVAIDLRRLIDGKLALDELICLLGEFRLNPIGIVSARQHPDASLPQIELHDPATVKRAEPEEAPRQQAEARAETLVVEKPLRSGQQVYSSGDIVVLDVVSYGAEVIAGGNIHVYAPLRGRALAGVRGDHGARIFSTCLEPELVSIAGVYKTCENALPNDLRGKPAQIRLDREKLIFESLSLT